MVLWVPKPQYFGSFPFSGHHLAGLSMLMDRSSDMGDCIWINLQTIFVSTLPNVFVLNCQMYLPQIVKFICLKLPNIFVSKLQRACCWIARRPIWETAPILETLIQFRTPLVQTLATEEKQPLSPTYWYLSKDYFSLKLLVLDQNKVPFKY